MSDQLKDLYDQARYARSRINKTEFFLEIADTMDLSAVMAVSPSFSQFHNQVSDW